jgi:hypothetical protein
VKPLLALKKIALPESALSSGCAACTDFPFSGPFCRFRRQRFVASLDNSFNPAGYTVSYPLESKGGPSSALMPGISPWEELS